MKAISVLGTSSNAGKSWVNTALCAWLRRQGVRVAPFKAQNMANNAYATLEGGEIGVAQAVQAEACGLRPTVEMNPILLKPNGPGGSQIVRLGKAGETLSARDYYGTFEDSWRLVRETLDGWRGRCDALVMEGAGNPVELNLMDRDIVNLRPIEYVDGKWILVSNIELGGVFAQVVGTWSLLPDSMRARGLGFLVNRFHGDLSLFDGARSEFSKHTSLPYLGALPFQAELWIDDEDSMNAVTKSRAFADPMVAWIRFPRVSNSQDMQPWLQDSGIQNVWTESEEAVRRARAIVLPGSKNTIADLRWLKAAGLGSLVVERAKEGVPVVGICGGYQMLGTRLEEDGDVESGLGLLPVVTTFVEKKRVERRLSRFGGEEWESFEIHTGVTQPAAGARGLQTLLETRPLGGGKLEPEGLRLGNVFGSYQHGLFDGASMRRHFVEAAGLAGVEISNTLWKDGRRKVYDAMADLLERRMDMDPLRAYFGL